MAGLLGRTIDYALYCTCSTQSCCSTIHAAHAVFSLWICSQTYDFSIVAGRRTLYPQPLSSRHSKSCQSFLSLPLSVRRSTLYSLYVCPLCLQAEYSQIFPIGLVCNDRFNVYQPCFELYTFNAVLLLKDTRSLHQCWACCLSRLVSAYGYPVAVESPV
jgi:hypothetical protein